MLRLATFLLVFCLVPAGHALAAPWLRPVEGGALRRFAVGPDRFAAGQHRGVDLAAPLGARVRSACDGRVRFAGVVGSAGRTVSVTCGPLVATYLHLGAIAVARGALVRAGDRLGTVGRSGRVEGPTHLHLGARRVADGRYVDPLTLFGRRPWVPPTAVPAPGRAPRPERPAPALRPPAAVPRVVARRAPSAVPWPAVAGLALLVAAAAPVTAGRRRTRRARRVHGAAAARR